MRIPGPKWGAGRPPLETPKSRCAIRIGRTPRHLRGWSFGAVGEGRERVRARHDCRTSTASGWGLCPLAPHVPRLGTFAGHARLGGCAPWPPAFPVGERPPIMRVCAWDNVRCGFCSEAYANLRGSSCRNAARSSVTPLARLWPQATLARPPGGIPKGAQPSLASLCLLSAGQKVGARRGLSASKGKVKILSKRKEGQ